MDNLMKMDHMDYIFSHFRLLLHITMIYACMLLNFVSITKADAQIPSGYKYISFANADISWR